MRRILTTLALGLAVAATGCAEFQDMGIATRNKNAAYSAWKRAKWDYFRQGVPHRTREHLGRGFQQGYYDVAAGGNGQVPLFPPNYYWGVAYQNPRGTQLIGAWFRGYQDGSIAAERDGLGRYTTLPSSWAPPYAPGTNPPEQTGDAGEALPPVPGVDILIPSRPSTEMPLVIPDGPSPGIVPPVVPPANPPVMPRANPPLIKPKTVDPSAEFPAPGVEAPVALTSADDVSAVPGRSGAAAAQQTLFIDDQTGELPSAEPLPVFGEPNPTAP